MGSAFTPGLAVSPLMRVEKERRLPLKGKTLVKEGDAVEPSTVVARAEFPGALDTLKLDQTLGIEPSEVRACLRVKEGDKVTKGQVIAEMRAFFGLFKSEAKATCDGTVEFFSEVTGHLGIRRPPEPVEVAAYIRGRVKSILPEEGVIVETTGAMIQGIFGVGGERQGKILRAVSAPDAEMRAGNIPAKCKGCILIGGGLVHLDALKAAAERGAHGVVAGGILDKDLSAFVGHDIGVAVTGQEAVPLTLILTEGFGPMAMAERTFKLLSSLEGKTASLNGATQIRAGALRPEVIVPSEGAGAETVPPPPSQELKIGTRVRIIRVPHFGQLASVTALPNEPVVLATGSQVRVLEAELPDGKRAMIPRANVEIVG